MKGVPVSLMDPLDDSISQALKENLPPGCGLKPNHNGLDLEHLKFGMQVWPNDESSETSTCEGVVRLRLGMRNNRLVVVDRKYDPQN